MFKIYSHGHYSIVADPGPFPDLFCKMDKTVVGIWIEMCMDLFNVIPGHVIVIFIVPCQAGDDAHDLYTPVNAGNDRRMAERIHAEKQYEQRLFFHDNDPGQKAPVRVGYFTSI